MTHAPNASDEIVNSPSPAPAPSGQGSGRRKGRAAPPPRRYVATLYARATEDEKRRIEQKALAAGLSVSRYLVRAAAEEKLPPSREERKRLEELLYRFKRASLFLDHLVTTSTSGPDRSGGGGTGAAAGVPRPEEVREAARLLASLATELKRRL